MRKEYRDYLLKSALHDVLEGTQHTFSNPKSHAVYVHAKQLFWNTIIEHKLLEVEGNKYIIYKGDKAVKIVYYPDTLSLQEVREDLINKGWHQDITIKYREE